MNRTSAYVCTLDPKSEADMDKLAIIRATVKASNANLRWLDVTGQYGPEQKRLRVCVKGRLGKNNPNAEKYRAKRCIRGPNGGLLIESMPNGDKNYVTEPGAIDTSGIRLEDAARYDVYIQTR